MIRSAILVTAGLVLFLCGALRAEEGGQPKNTPPAPRQVQAIPAGTVVEIRLESGEKIRGRVVESAKDRLVVQWVNGDQIENRAISLAEIKSIKIHDGKPSRAKTIGRYILVGALGGAVGVAELAREKP